MDTLVIVFCSVVSLARNHVALAFRALTAVSHICGLCVKIFRMQKKYLHCRACCCLYGEVNLHYRFIYLTIVKGRISCQITSSFTGSQGQPFRRIVSITLSQARLYMIIRDVLIKCQIIPLFIPVVSHFHHRCSLSGHLVRLWRIILYLKTF